MSIETAFSAFAREIRQQLEDANIGASVEFGLRARGAPCQGDMVVEFFMRELYGSELIGPSAKVVIDEFLRRRGWKLENSPLLISHTPEDSDEA